MDFVRERQIWNATPYNCNYFLCCVVRTTFAEPPEHLESQANVPGQWMNITCVVSDVLHVRPIWSSNLDVRRSLLCWAAHATLAEPPEDQHSQASAP
eukprot:2674508-Alexandrium_andersonii.AAC.1